MKKARPQYTRLRPLPRCADANSRDRRFSSGARKKIPNRSGDLRAVGFEGKVARIEEAHFGSRNIAFERLGARRQEERIVLAPGRQEGWLVLAKVGLARSVARFASDGSFQ